MFRSHHLSSARFADKPEDFAKLGIQPGRIEAFEDGMRTEGGPGGYEWWYFDSHLHDGSSLVIVFYTKPQLNPDGELAPFGSLELDRPEQPPIRVEAHVSPYAFSARRDRCDVRIGENTFRGNLHEYDIHFSHDGVTIDITLTGQVVVRQKGSGVGFDTVDRFQGCRSKEFNCRRDVPWMSCSCVAGDLACSGRLQPGGTRRIMRRRCAGLRTMT